MDKDGNQSPVREASQAANALAVCAAVAAVLWWGSTQCRPSKPEAQHQDPGAEREAPPLGMDIGYKPLVSGWDGLAEPAGEWLRDNLHDHRSAEVVWAYEPTPTKSGWRQKVRLRAKNGFGAYVVQDFAFFIKHDRVVDVSVD